MPLTKTSAHGDLPAQRGGGAPFIIFTKAPCQPCPGSVSSHYVTLGKVISLPGLGFPFEELSSIKQRFNPDSELACLGPLKNTDVQAPSQTNDQILGWGGWVQGISIFLSFQVTLMCSQD